jgi:hypothetical protein
MTAALFGRVRSVCFSVRDGRVHDTGPTLGPEARRRSAGGAGGAAFNRVEKVLTAADRSDVRARVALDADGSVDARQWARSVLLLAGLHAKEALIGFCWFAC